VIPLPQDPIFLGSLVIDRRQLAIGRAFYEAGRRHYRHLFALRCSCGRLTLGCRDHSFCGVCENCHVFYESWRPAGFYHVSPLLQHFQADLKKALDRWNALHHLNDR